VQYQLQFDKVKEGGLQDGDVSMHLLAIPAAIAVYEGIIQWAEFEERKRVYEAAEQMARALEKPLLVVGRPKGRHPCGSLEAGDICLDIDPSVCAECQNAVIGDVRDLYFFRDGQFGAAAVMHVLEHLRPEDAASALDELYRVAEYVFIAAPHKISLMAIFHPDHKSWITVQGDAVTIDGR